MDFLSLQKALSNSDKKKKEKKEEIDAIVYFDEIDKRYGEFFNSVFSGEFAIVEAAFEMFDAVDFEKVEIPMSMKELASFI